MAADGSLYIDPNGVQNVAIQMKMVADEIEYAQCSIAPQIQSAIFMGQPLVAVAPGVQNLLWQVQDQLNLFKYLSANIVVSELRTTAFSLLHIAQQASSSIALLTTLQFDVPEEIRQVAKSISEGNAWSETMTDLTSDLSSTAGEVGEAGDGNDGPLSMFLDIGLDIVSSKHIDEHTIIADTLGGLLAATLGSIPAVRVAIITAAVMHFTSIYSASILSSEAAMNNDPAVAAQMQHAAENFQLVSEDTDVGKIFDDLGGLDADLITGQDANLGADLGSTLIDSGKLLTSAPAFLLEEGNAGIALSDNLVQNLPLPSSFKSSYNQGTTSAMGAINNAADFFVRTLPNGMQSGWNNLTSSVFSFVAG